MSIFHRALSVLLVCVVCATNVFAQFQSPVKYEVKEALLSSDKLQVTFTIKADAGWHVYGTDIPDGGPTRACLTLEQQEGVTPLGTLQQSGNIHRAMDEMFGMEVTYIEGTATFVQQFQIVSPQYQVSGYLTFGACNDSNCMPPTNIDFDFKGTTNASAQLSDETTASVDAENAESDSLSAETGLTNVTAELASSQYADLWAPVISELKAFDTPEETVDSTNYLRVFLLGLLGGLLALLTPCVWPIIPMTVSFFLKRSKTRSQGVRDAMLYGISIVVIYLLLGLFVTIVFGASALNALSTNALFNIVFFAMLLVFGASFLGGFELTLPGRWTNAVNNKSESTTGLLSIFFMAFTLSLVSFSCTGPIIGFLLVEVAQEGSILAPTIGMSGFAIALALPFTLFALFPAWLKSAPRSGGWMNIVKVSLGFLELAFSLKFLSVADLAYGWGILDREAFLSLWIVIFALWGAYLLGVFRLPHDEDEYDDEGNIVVKPRIGVLRLFSAMSVLAFSVYMVPGLWGAPCKAVSAFAPPMFTQDFNLNEGETNNRFTDYEQGMAYARQHNMPVMLDFTGYGCVNCRKMEAAVWTDPEVSKLMNEKYVLITLFVDDKTALPRPIEVEESSGKVKLRTVGDKWSYLQRTKFGANAQPFYVLVDANGHPLTGSRSYNEDVIAFRDFLQAGLR